MNNSISFSAYSSCTVNVDCVKFEYVVLAKYHHMLIFEFDLLTKQHILILFKNVALVVCLSNPCYLVGFCTDLISTIQKCVTVVQSMVVAYIWKQSVGQPCLISESWANVDGLQKFYVYFKRRKHAIFLFLFVSQES